MTTSSGPSSIEALLSPATNRPAFRNDASVSAERGLQFEKQLSDAQDQSNSQRALQRQNTAERAAQDAARRRTVAEREQADAVADERDADKRAADKKAAERAAAAKASQQDALATSILKTGEQGAQVDLQAEQTYHAVDDVSADTDPAEETRKTGAAGAADAAKTKAGAAAEMSALAQVLAVEAAAAKKIAEAMAGNESDAAAKVPTVTSVETTSGPDGIHARLSIELSLDGGAATGGTAGATGTPLNADAVAALTGEQNAVLAALLGLDTDASVDAATGVKGLTGTAGAAPGATGAGGSAAATGSMGRGAVSTMPDGASLSVTKAPSVAGAPSSGSAADAAAQVAGAAAAGITQTGTPDTSSSSAQTGANGQTASAAATTGQTAGQPNSATGSDASTDLNAAINTTVPGRIMVNGQWTSGSDGPATTGSVSATGATDAATAATRAAQTADATDDSGDSQSGTGAASTTGTGSAAGADGSQSTPAPDAFSSLISQAQQTQQADQPTAVTGSGYSTAAGESVAEQVGQQLAAQLRAVRDGNHRAVIHLSPKELGDVTVTLNVNRGDVQLSLIAAPAALTQLQAGLNDLRDQMSQAGLNLGDVSMQQSTDAGASMTGGGGSSSGNQPGYSSGSPVSGVAGSSGIPSSSATSAPTNAAAANGNLDVLI
jgi:flagellar hook-length control protein FliK